MTYFDFLSDVIDNFRVSKMIEIIKVEEDVENNDLLAVAYEATRALIVVAKYKERPDIDMPQVQGFSQLDYVKQIINLANDAAKTSVKFKENSDGIATETIFKMDRATIKNKNVAKSLLPETPKKLSAFSANFDVDLTKDDIVQITKLLSLTIFNASAYLTKSSKGNLTFVLTNDVDSMDYETEFELPEDTLEEPFKVDLDRLMAILKVGSNGVNLAIADKQNLVKITKENDAAIYQYFLIRKAS